MSPRYLLRGGPDPRKGWRCWKLTRLSREPRCCPSSLRGGLGHRVPVDCRILRWVSQDAGKRGTSGWWALMRLAGKTRSPWTPSALARRSDNPGSEIIRGDPRPSAPAVLVPMSEKSVSPGTPPMSPHFPR